MLSRSLSSERQHGVKIFLQSRHRLVLAAAPCARPSHPCRRPFPASCSTTPRRGPNAPALREKEFGIWQTLSWSALAELVEALAGGLAEAGLKRGQHLVVIGENRPRLYASMLAAQSLGAIPVPLYQDAAAGEFVFPIANADVAFADRRGPGAGRQADRGARPCPQLARIWYDDPRGLRNYSEPGLASLDALVEAGRAFAADACRLLRRARSSRRSPTTSRRCSSPRGRPAMPRASSTPTTR